LEEKACLLLYNIIYLAESQKVDYKFLTILWVTIDILALHVTTMFSIMVNFSYICNSSYTTQFLHACNVNSQHWCLSGRLESISSGCQFLTFSIKKIISISCLIPMQVSMYSDSCIRVSDFSIRVLPTNICASIETHSSDVHLLESANWGFQNQHLAITILFIHWWFDNEKTCNEIRAFWIMTNPDN